MFNDSAFFERTLRGRFREKKHLQATVQFKNGCDEVCIALHTIQHKLEGASQWCAFLSEIVWVVMQIEWPAPRVNFWVEAQSQAQIQNKIDWDCWGDMQAKTKCQTKTRKHSRDHASTCRISRLDELFVFEVFRQQSNSRESNVPQHVTSL